MKDPLLNESIDRVKDMPMPECPAALEHNVLRRITLSRHESGLNLLEWMLGILPQPRLILSAVVLAMAVSAGIVTIANERQTMVSYNRAYATNVLGFEVFEINEILNLKAR